MSKTRYRTAIKITLKSGLTLIGMLPLLMYDGPGRECIAREDCGAWLARFITQQGARGVFTATGINFAAANATLSWESIDVASLQLANQKTTLGVASNVIFLILYMGSQGIPTFIAAESVGDQLWETLLIDLGNAPAAAYTGVHLIRMAETKFKKMMDVIQRQRFTLKKLFLPLNHEEKVLHAQLQYYHQQQGVFIRTLQKRLNYVRRYPQSFDLAIARENPLSGLLSAEEDQFSDCWWRKTIRGIGWLSGGALALSFSSLFFKNALEGLQFFLKAMTSRNDVIQNLFQLFKHFIPFFSLEVLTTSALLSSGIFSAIDFLGQGFAQVLSILMDVLSGKPIQSLFFQRQPFLCLLMLFSAGGLSALSYSLVDTLAVHELENDMNTTEKIYARTADVGMVLYHFFGLMKLVNLFYHALSKDQHVQLFKQMHAELIKLHSMDTLEFKAFVEENPRELNEAWQLQTFDQQVTPQNQNVELVVENLPVQSVSTSNRTNSGQWLSFYKSASYLSGPQNEYLAAVRSEAPAMRMV